jgi:hypothetical protein
VRGKRDAVAAGVLGAVERVVDLAEQILERDGATRGRDAEGV